MVALFPSLIVRADGLSAQGSFAKAQTEFLDPDPGAVHELRALLARHEAGIVSHFYMDAELQGILYALDWPHVHVSDSLKMADAATEMVERGAKMIIVLGVDFMSENVRALLDAGGHEHIPVYRVASEPIGCSLAESAEARAYEAYLRQAEQSERPLHVVYINTSLRTKARAQHRVPTITCTSSNVVQTMLQAAAQDPTIDVWFGPDTYMGHNLVELLTGLAQLDPAEIERLHPAHTPASVRALIGRFHYFRQGNCVVHHMFGHDVVRRLEESYADAYITAHLEVPGEMFALALRAQRQGRGVVGSTADILAFVRRRVAQAAKGGSEQRLRFVLGTEAGMVTAIVRDIRAGLPAGLEVEIIFPVASESIATTDDAALPIVPGVAGGEGCSVAGGCATCPYMKMNSLDAVVRLLGKVGVEDLSAYEPEKYMETIDGCSIAALGSRPILHMRDFQRSGVLGAALMAEIAAHRGTGSR